MEMIDAVEAEDFQALGDNADLYKIAIRGFVIRVN